MSEINTSQNATRARQSRPVAPHSKRARTEPRPVNTHDWVRSSGRTLAATQRGAGRVNNSACSASACAARALAAWPHSRIVHAPSLFFGKHIYRLNAPLTAVDPVDPQIPSRLNPPGSISLWFYAVHRAYS